MKLRPFNISLMFRRISEAIRPFAKAALFELADEGFTSPFEQIVACLISIRTPAEVSRLTPHEIDKLIGACTYHERKAHQIHQIAREAMDKYRGAIPCDAEVLLSLGGVGPKCANLVLGIVCKETRIGVDIHVHRVTNRWGYVATKTPQQTTAALELKLPRRYWVDINRLLVPFGKHICTGKLPRCSTCPVLEFCRQVGVEAHR
jgi:endonuclease III